MSSSLEAIFFYVLLSSLLFLLSPAYPIIVDSPKYSWRSTSSLPEHEGNDGVRKLGQQEDIKPTVVGLANYALSYPIQGNNGARMFGFFFKSRNFESDRVILWLNGGPGVTSNIGLFYENGPFKIEDDYTLSWNVNGWDKVSNILYVDQPIGTGFSYLNENSRIRDTQNEVIEDLYEFLQAFFTNHGGYAEKKFFITGQSYAARYASALALHIHNQNNLVPRSDENIEINLQGIAIGNPLIDFAIQYGTIPRYALQNYLITEERCLHIESEFIPKCKATTKACVEGDEFSCIDAFEDCDTILLETVKTMTRDVKEMRGQGLFNQSFDISILDHQQKVIGWQKKFGGLTYIKVKDAGQMVSMDQPEVILHLLVTWMELKL